MNITIKRKRTEDQKHRMTLHEGEVPYLSFPVLDEEDWLVHGLSTRLGGVSEGETGTMNMSFKREPETWRVKENYIRISDAIGFDPERLVFSAQTHTNNVRSVNEADAGIGYNREQDMQDIDALITNVPGLTLAVFMSDCVPLLVADSVNRAIGGAHSGWRGTVSDIGGEMIREMKKQYGTDPSDLVAVIGQSICQDCFEVGEEVVEQFRNVYPKENWKDLFYRKENGKFQLDLWEACRLNFVKAGVKPENIYLPDICTKCNPQLLFSHRVQQGKQGNMAAFISIRP